MKEAKQAPLPTISLRLDPELRSAYAKAAARDDRPVAYVMRKALRDWIETHPAGQVAA